MREKQYGKLSNIVYALKNIWQWDKIYYFWFFPAIPLEVALPLLGAYFPKLIIDSVENRISIGRLFAVILSYFALMFLADAWQRFCKAKRDSRRYLISNFYEMKMIEKHLRMDYANVDNPIIQKKYNKAIQDIWYNGCSAETIWESLLSFGINLFGIATYGTIILSVSPIILVFLAFSAAAVYFYGRYYTKYLDKNREKWQELDRKMGYIASFSEKFEYAKEIRLCHMTDWLEEKYRTLEKECFQWTKKLTFRSSANGVMNAVLLLIQNGLAYWYLCSMFFQDSITTGDFVFYFSVITGFSAWLNSVIYGVNGLIRDSEIIGYYREYFDVEDHYNHGTGCALPSPGEALEIVFEHVFYRHAEAEEYFFEDLNFCIKKGERLAIVGENGAGKTTLIKLICGLYFPEKGRVLVNGIPTTEFNIEEYYSLFSVVFQDMYMLPVSIREFVASKPAEEIDGAKLEEALKQAGLEEKVKSLKHGIDTKLMKGIFEDAIDLSGGEQQKLMLARALYKDAPVVILDEPTAALDAIAESRLYEQYNQLVAGKTSIYISHRLASTHFCDRIVLLEKGRVVEEGTCAELLNKGGKYAYLYQLQSRYYQEAEA